MRKTPAFSLIGKPAAIVAKLRDLKKEGSQRHG